MTVTPRLSTLPFQHRHFPPGAGLVLREVREGCGRSRREVATAASIAPRTLARIERGSQLPTWATLERICDALDVSAFQVARRWASDAMDLPDHLPSAPGLGVRSIRRARGLTLRHLADLAGVSSSTLSRFERGLIASRRLAATMGLEVEGAHDLAVSRGGLALAEALGFDDLEGLRAAIGIGGDAGDDPPAIELDEDGLPLISGPQRGGDRIANR